MLRSFRHRNYRLFFGGQGTSLIGTWMQSIALSWLVYRLTGSALLLGTVAFVGQIPVLLLAPVAGVLADRWNLRRLLVMTQSLALLQAAVLAWLTLTNRVEIWQILCLSGVLGVVNAFDMPLRQAFVVHLVERPEDLTNAIALNSFLVNGARLVGPSLAGLIIPAVGEGICFLINALSYLAVIVSLLMMIVPPRPAQPHKPSIVHGLREGFAYAFGFAPIRTVLMLLALSSLMGMSLQHDHASVCRASPGRRSENLRISPRRYRPRRGYRRALSRRAPLRDRAGKAHCLRRRSFRSEPDRRRRVPNRLAGHVAHVHAGHRHDAPDRIQHTILQTIVDDDKRGRVMSIYAMAFLGMTPFGSLIAGSLAHAIGTPATLTIGGASCFIGAIIFAILLPSLRPMIRPIYIRKGLIQESPGS